jgi:murein DD-endopeptidase MepM/ murein hydrolase activator NlpD
VLRLLAIGGAALVFVLTAGGRPASPSPKPSPAPTPPPAPVDLMRPVAGAVETQGFGCTSFYLEPYSADCPTRHFHSGIDLAAPLGTPVLAAETGIVLAAEMSTVGYGLYVLVDHGGGLATLYAHLNLLEVRAGDLVVRGSEIGKLGSTGFSTGPHLHFEVRSAGRPTDPSPYLAAVTTHQGANP